MKTNPDTQVDSQGLLTYPQAAARLSISPRTFATLVAAGKIPAIRVSARRLAIDPRDLNEFIARRRIQATR